MRFRRSFRRPGMRLRPRQQLNWITAFSGAPVVVPSLGLAAIPLTLQVESETGSDQVVQRIRGEILSTIPIASTAIGQITYGIVVEDAKDITLGNIGALPDPRGGSLEDVEPDKYMWLGLPWRDFIASNTTQLIGIQHVDVRAKRKLDYSHQQLIMLVSNDSNAAVSVQFYIRSLIKEL